MKKPKLEVVSVRLPVFVVQAIDKLVGEGKFRNRADFINFALQKALIEVGAYSEVSREEVECFIQMEPKEGEEDGA